VIEISDKPFDSLDELRKAMPLWEKESTEFTKAELLLLNAGDTYQVRIKRIFEGKYDEPLVIVDEFSKLGAIGEPAGPIQKEERRLPTFMVRRAMEKDVPLHEKQVYLVAFLAKKATTLGNDFNQGYVKLIGTEFLV